MFTTAANEMSKHTERAKNEGGDGNQSYPTPPWFGVSQRFLKVAIVLVARLFIVVDLGAVPTIFSGCFQKAYLLFDVVGAGHVFVANHCECVTSGGGLSRGRP